MDEQGRDLRAEIERMRGQLAALGQRHADELRAMRESLTKLERSSVEEERPGSRQQAAKEAPVEPAAPEASTAPVTPSQTPPPLPPPAKPKAAEGHDAPPRQLPPPEVAKKVEKFRMSDPTPRVIHKVTPPDQATPLPHGAVQPPPQEKKAQDPAKPATPSAQAAPPAPPAKTRGSLEMRMGQVWLVRIGIALLVTGLVLLGNYAYRNWIRELPAAVRLGFLFLGSFGLCGAGVWVGRREGMRRFGEVVLAGGLAFFYWCTFAAHHVDRLRVIGSPVLAAVLLLVAAGVMVAVSLKRDSKATAVLGLLLASYATVLQPLGWLSAASNLVLGGAGMALMLRPGWATPGVATMVGSYGAFLWWQLAGAARGTPEDPAALWFLPPLWAVFALPGLLGRYAKTLSARARAWLSGANNGVFFALYSLLWLTQQGSGEYWRVPGVFGLVLLVLGVIGRSKDSTTGGVHLTQGLAALMLATVLKLEGYQLALGLAGEALVLAGAFYKFRGKSELAFTLLAGAGAILATFFDIRAGDLIAAGAEPPLWSTGLVALLLVMAAVVMRASCRNIEGEIRSVARVTSGIDLLGGSLVAATLWCPKLPDPWPGPAAALLAVAAAAGMSAGRKEPWMRELLVVIGMFLIGCLVRVTGEPGSAVASISVLLLASIPALMVLALHRFSRATELVASLVAMATVGIITLIDVTREFSMQGGDLVTGWCGWSVALLFGATGVWLRQVHDSLDEKIQSPVRASVLPMLLAGAAVALGAWLVRLDPGWRAPVATAIALALSGASLLGDRRRWIPELGWVALGFAAVALPLLSGKGPTWSPLAVLGLSGITCWLWHRQVPEPTSDSGPLPDPAELPGVLGWLTAAMVPIPLLVYWSRIDLPLGAYPGYAGLAALVLVALGLGLHCQRLAATGALLHLAGLAVLFGWPEDGRLVLAGFETPLLALGTLVLVILPWARARLDPASSVITHVVSRGCTFLGWLIVWYIFSPAHWVDVIALSAAAVACLTLRWPIDPDRSGALLIKSDPILHLEAWGFLAVAVAATVLKGATGPWHEIGDAADWQRWAVAPAVLTCAVLLRRSGRLSAPSMAAIFLVGAALLAAWSTRMLVWRHGWTPVGVLWTLLGFAYVSTGLWQRLAVLRQLGFALLALALVKLFAVDVWDFDAFTRVVAFLALGVALVLLGFFYNRFAEVLKKLLENDG